MLGAGVIAEVQWKIAARNKDLRFLSLSELA